MSGYKFEDQLKEDWFRFVEARWRGIKENKVSSPSSG